MREESIGNNSEKVFYTKGGFFVGER